MNKEQEPVKPIDQRLHEAIANISGTPPIRKGQLSADAVNWTVEGLDLNILQNKLMTAKNEAKIDALIVSMAQTDEELGEFNELVEANMEALIEKLEGIAADLLKAYEAQQPQEEEPNIVTATTMPSMQGSGAKQ